MDALIGWPGGDWQATARLAATLVIGYIALMWLASVIWTYRDIASRTRDPISQAVMLSIVVVLPIIGLPIYMALRPTETLQQAYDREIEQEAILADIQTLAACPGCRRPAEASFRVCAYCGTALKDPCPTCNELMLHAWRYCPHCATPRALASKSATPVSGPAPRLDLSTGDEGYGAEPAAPQMRSSLAATGVNAEVATNGSANGSLGTSRPPLRRRSVAARAGSPPETDTPRADAPRPAPARRPATDE